MISCELMTGYAEGYAECISDLEKALPTDKTVGSVELLNCYIIALHLLKAKAQEMQEEIDSFQKELPDESCFLCAECLECEDEYEQEINDVVSALERSGFTVIRGGI